MNTPTSRRSLSAIGFLLISSLISGCSLLQAVGLVSAPPPPAPPALPAPAPIISIPIPETPLSMQPLTVQLDVQVANDVNPDIDSRPSPIKVRVYLTELSANFNEIEFGDIFGVPGDKLDPEPLYTEILRPGSVKTFVLEGMKTQSQIVVAAAYREPYQTEWLAIERIKIDDAVLLEAKISALAVDIRQLQ